MDVPSIAPSADAVTASGPSGAGSAAPPANAISVVKYSDKAMALFGDTRPVKDDLKVHGGRFNASLTAPDGGSCAGWIFSLTKRADVVKMLMDKGVAVVDKTGEPPIRATAPCKDDSPSVKRARVDDVYEDTFDVNTREEDAQDEYLAHEDEEAPERRVALADAC